MSDPTKSKMVKFDFVVPDQGNYPYYVIYEIDNTGIINHNLNKFKINSFAIYKNNLDHGFVSISNVCALSRLVRKEMIYNYNGYQSSDNENQEIYIILGKSKHINLNNCLFQFDRSCFSILDNSYSYYNYEYIFVGAPFYMYKNKEEKECITDGIYKFGFMEEINNIDIKNTSMEKYFPIAFSSNYIIFLYAKKYVSFNNYYNVLNNKKYCNDKNAIQACDLIHYLPILIELELALNLIII